jgi:hypothetical protein
LQHALGRHHRRALMADEGWARRFDDPIPLPDGRKPITLHDAATFITKLPKREHDTMLGVGLFSWSVPRNAGTWASGSALEAGN